jgi:ABC-type glycerol-3-phosphate transport system substrate-binding protein
MLKKINISRLILPALLLAVVLCACGKDEHDKNMNIIIGNWGNDYNVATFIPKNDAEEKTLARRKQIIAENDFIIQEKNIGTYSEMMQLVTTSIAAGQPAADVFTMEPAWVTPLKNQNLLYPISDSNAVDFSPKKPGDGRVEWNQIIRDAFTFGGKTYAMGIGSGTAHVIFYNKRSFLEAGLDPDLPYDMQRDGAWTWDNFFEICKILTRDIDNDGIIDRYALCTTPFPDFVDAVIASNNANYIDRDPVTGKFSNATIRPEFIEGLQYVMKMRNEGVMMFPPPNARWSWHYPLFADGTIAMRVEDLGVWSQLKTMKDDWGMVLFPRGPRADTYRVYQRLRVLAVPAGFEPERVDTILRAVELWNTPVDDTPNSWKDKYYHVFRDPRAIDETLAMLHNPDHFIFRYHTLVPGIQTGSLIWILEGDPVRVVESVYPWWVDAIDRANAMYD